MGHKCNFCYKTPPHIAHILRDSKATNVVIEHQIVNQYPHRFENP